MKNPEPRRRQTAVQIWTYPQARAAVPYISAIMRSLRETWLEARSLHRREEQIAARPGRPNRSALVAYADVVRAAQKADVAHEEAAQELRDVGILCEDPSRGQALLPCVHQHVLAWIVFDLFADDVLRCWRYHNDPAETERPIRELAANPAEQTCVL